MLQKRLQFELTYFETAVQHVCHYVKKQKTKTKTKKQTYIHTHTHTHKKTKKKTNKQTNKQNPNNWQIIHLRKELMMRAFLHSQITELVMLRLESSVYILF